jgi:hypothetical protein
MDDKLKTYGLWAGVGAALGVGVALGLGLRVLAAGAAVGLGAGAALGVASAVKGRHKDGPHQLKLDYDGAGAALH